MKSVNLMQYKFTLSVIYIIFYPAHPENSVMYFFLQMTVSAGFTKYLLFLHPCPGKSIAACRCQIYSAEI